MTLTEIVRADSHTVLSVANVADVTRSRQHSKLHLRCSPQMTRDGCVKRHQMKGAANDANFTVGTGKNLCV